MPKEGLSDEDLYHEVIRLRVLTRKHRQISEAAESQVRDLQFKAHEHARKMRELLTRLRKSPQTEETTRLLVECESMVAVLEKC